MRTQVIMRPVFNRPEMFKLSLDYEKAAREYYQPKCNFHTIFIFEYGYDKKCLELIRDYPYSYSVIKRPKRFGLSANILEGFKTAFHFSEDWLIYIEDDILLHKTYFEYIDVVLSLPDLGKWSVISAYNFDDAGKIDEVRRFCHYAALAPVINKEFFYTYIVPCANSNYYNNPPAFVTELDNLYKDYQKDGTYRYKKPMHYQQAGLINRLTDVAKIEEDRWVIMPGVNRQVHIGFFGYNRPGGTLKGDTFEERLRFLEGVISDPKKMYELSATKQYNDYKAFSNKLKAWEGTLRLV